MLGPATQAAIDAARERYLDMVQMRRTDWNQPRVKAAVAALEFEAARLLNGQVRTGRDSVRGRFTNRPVEDLAELKDAFAETLRAMDALALAFACKRCRFYRSARVGESLALAEDFLQRGKDLAQHLVPFGVMPPRLHEDPRNAIEWLWLCGDALPPDALSAFKKIFSPLRAQKQPSTIRLPTDDPPFTAFLAAVLFNEWRLAHRARAELAALLRAALRADGSLVGERGKPLDILYAAGLVRDAALYDHLTRGTALALDSQLLKALAKSLTGFVAQAGYAGGPDALLVSAAPRSRFADLAQAFAGLVWSAATLMLAGETVDADVRPTLARLQAKYDSYIRQSAYSEATAGILEMGHLAPQAAGRQEVRPPAPVYYPAAGYIAAHPGDFFASVRLPFPEGASEAAPDDARLLGAMNLLTDGLNPNALLSAKAPQWAWPGTTLCEALRTGSGLMPGTALKGMAILGGLVLENGALAAASVAAQGENVRMGANRSWFIFEDKVAVLGSKISASTTDIANPGWAASPKDRFPWFGIELPQPTMVSAVRIYYRVKGGVYVCVPREIIIQVSLDGQDFRDVRSITKFPASGSKPGGYATVKFRPAQARYVRFFFPEGADGDSVRLSDVQVYYVEQPKDMSRLGREIPNLASPQRGARAAASSQWDADNAPDKALTGRGIPGVLPLPARTCVFVLGAKGGPITANDGVSREVSMPEKGKETKIGQTRWINLGGLGCLFMPPANIILQNEKDQACIVYIDHAGADSFGVVYIPNQTAEETARSAEAELIMVKVGRDSHYVYDKASAIRALAVFAPCEKGDVVTPGTGCALYKAEGERLVCVMHPRLLREGLAIRVPGIQEAWINGKKAPVSVQGDLVVLGGQ